MGIEMHCPWCDGTVSVDVADAALFVLTCPHCVTTVDLAGVRDERAEMPLAA
jgi:hypothetical protein